MAKVKTVTNFNTSEIKKEITNENVKNQVLRVFIIGYVCEQGYKDFDKDEIYYCVSIATTDYSFDLEVIDTNSLAKAKQRQEQLCNSLHGYRGNDTVLVEYGENESLYSDY